MINKINNQTSDILINVSKKNAQTSRVSSESQADASLQTSYGDMIREAQQLQTEDITAVERARRLLLSGQLDSPESIRQAAENIVEFGI